MSDWSAQPVFRNDSVRILRREASFSRAALSQAMAGFSIGRQKSFWEESFPFPTNYICGEKDEKFSAIGGKIKLRRPSTFVQSLSGGHSLHVGQPRELAMALHDFHGRFS